MNGFTIIGLWVIAMIVTFVVLSVGAFMMHDEQVDFLGAFGIMLGIFVVLLELALSAAYVNFKNNPEKFGYTRIEQEIETEVIDE